MTHSTVRARHLTELHRGCPPANQGCQASPVSPALLANELGSWRREKEEEEKKGIIHRPRNEKTCLSCTQSASLRVSCSGKPCTAQPLPQPPAIHQHTPAPACFFFSCAIHSPSATVNYITVCIIKDQTISTARPRMVTSAAPPSMRAGSRRQCLQKVGNIKKSIFVLSKEKIKA